MLGDAFTHRSSVFQIPRLSQTNHGIRFITTGQQVTQLLGILGSSPDYLGPLIARYDDRQAIGFR